MRRPFCDADKKHGVFLSSRKKETHGVSSQVGRLTHSIPLEANLGARWSGQGAGWQANLGAEFDMLWGKSMRLMVCVLVAGAALGGGCATKRYPMATPLSGAEITLMNCRELMLEGVKTDEMQKQIADTSQVDWRSVAGFLGDYGIGNAMAKSEADAALAARRASITTAQAQKGCLTPQEAATAPQ